MGALGIWGTRGEQACLRATGYQVEMKAQPPSPSVTS